MKSNSARVLPVNLAVVLVGLADLLTTVFWLHTGQAVEFNPIMAAVLKAGMPAFVLAKLATLGAYLGVMEWYRRARSLRFAQMTGWVTVLAYSGIYVISLACVNRGFLLG